MPLSTSHSPCISPPLHVCCYGSLCFQALSFSVTDCALNIIRLHVVLSGAVCCFQMKPYGTCSYVRRTLRVKHTPPHSFQFDGRYVYHYYYGHYTIIISIIISLLWYLVSHLMTKSYTYIFTYIARTLNCSTFDYSHCGRARQMTPYSSPNWFQR
jgi:hypothetical protein